MKPPKIPLEKILALEPACLRMAVPETYSDENGHMNVRWYAAIFDEAGDTLHARLGLTPEFHKTYGHYGPGEPLQLSTGSGRQ